ncbi:TRAP transporter large permease subunit [Stappia stellulata]|uniref:TRAP transporter large permease subunit n=1 Tax=Stappia stellulata TaxID=71235 RepID=UPI000429EE8E|nr:TRAP transporter large permease subunit [Stappia stellulata]
MDWLAPLALILACQIGLILAGVPVFFAFLTVVFGAAVAVFPGTIGVTLLSRSLIEGLSRFVLLPIPLFLMIGHLLIESGAGGRAIAAVRDQLGAAGRRQGFVALGSGVLLSAVSGSSLAAAALILNALKPAANRNGADSGPLTGAALASGGIAIFVPPSALAVLVASIAQVDVAAMLIAIVPLGACLALAHAMVIRLTERPAATARKAEREAPSRLRHHILRAAVIFASMVAGIAFGIATPTEAAALGLVTTIVLLAASGELDRHVLARAATRTATEGAGLLLVIAAAGIFSQILVFLGIAQGVRDTLEALAGAPLALLFACAIAAILLGCFVDGVSMALILVPLVLPVLTAAGIAPLHACLVILLCMEIGLITPPFGLLLIVASGVMRERMTFPAIVRAVLPFLAAKLIVLAGLCVLAAAVSG